MMPAGVGAVGHQTHKSGLGFNTITSYPKAQGVLEGNKRLRRSTLPLLRGISDGRRLGFDFVERLRTSRI